MGTKKGKQSKAGIGEIWDQVKGIRLTVRLTETGAKILEKHCQDLNISKGEAVERLIRGSTKESFEIKTERALSEEDILNALPLFAPEALVRFLQMISRLLAKVMPRNRAKERQYEMTQIPENIDFLSFLKQQDLELLSVESGVPKERLEAIVSGSELEHHEIIKLGRVFEKEPAEMIAFIKGKKANGSANTNN